MNSLTGNTVVQADVNALGRLALGLFRVIDNVRLARLGYVINLFVLLLLVAGTMATVTTFHAVANISGIWRDFDTGLARRIDLLGQIQHHLGYGGLAQNWPAAQAGDTKARAAVSTAISKVREAVAAYRQAGPGKDEAKALVTLDSTLSGYDQALQGGAGSINTTAAIHALEELRQLLQQARQQGADAVEDAIWRLSTTVGGVMIAVFFFLAFLGIFFYWFLRFRIARPLELMDSTMVRLAKGDTAVPVDYTDKSDEIGEMARAVSVFKDNAIVKAKMETQRAGLTISVQESTGQLVGQTSEVRKAMYSQSTAASAMSATAEELSVSIGSVAQSATNAFGLTQQTSAAVTSGQGAVQHTIAVMEETSALVSHAARKVHDLGEQSAAIQAIVATMQGIAKQTDLLALNASIEASRAGDAGRGFAVVADEVRKLAERSNQSAQDIHGILSTINEQVQEVSEQITTASGKAQESAKGSRQVEEALNRIATHNQLVVQAVDEIVHATQEQNLAGQDIARQVELVASNADVTLESIKEVDQLAKNLNTMMAGLAG